MGRARPDGDLGDAVGRPDRGAREGGPRRPRPRGGRHHEPARDDAPLGEGDRTAARERDRLAGPPDGLDLRRAARRRARADVHGEDGPRPRPVLRRDEAEVAPRQRAFRAGPRRPRRDRVRHRRLVAPLAAHGRRRPRDGRHEREPDAPLRHPRGRVGRRAARPPRRPARSPAPDRAVVRSRRDRFHRRHRRPDRRHRGRPAGGALRPGLRPPGPREEHVRDGLLSPPEHREDRGPLEEPAPDDGRLGHRRCAHVRPRRQRLRRRRSGAVAQGRSEVDP